MQLVCKFNIIELTINFSFNYRVDDFKKCQNLFKLVNDLNLYKLKFNTIFGW